MFPLLGRKRFLSLSSRARAWSHLRTAGWVTHVLLESWMCLCSILSSVAKRVHGQSVRILKHLILISYWFVVVLLRQCRNVSSQQSWLRGDSELLKCKLFIFVKFVSHRGEAFLHLNTFILSRSRSKFSFLHAPVQWWRETVTALFTITFSFYATYFCSTAIQREACFSPHLIRHV